MLSDLYSLNMKTEQKLLLGQKCEEAAKKLVNNFILGTLNV